MMNNISKLIPVHNPAQFIQDLQINNETKNDINIKIKMERIIRHINLWPRKQPFLNLDNTFLLRSIVLIAYQEGAHEEIRRLTRAVRPFLPQIASDCTLTFDVGSVSSYSFLLLQIPFFKMATKFKEGSQIFKGLDRKFTSPIELESKLPYESFLLLSNILAERNVPVINDDDHVVQLIELVDFLYCPFGNAPNWLRASLQGRLSTAINKENVLSVCEIVNRCALPITDSLLRNLARHIRTMEQFEEIVKKEPRLDEPLLMFNQLADRHITWEPAIGADVELFLNACQRALGHGLDLVFKDICMLLAAYITTSGSLLRLIEVACREPYIEMVAKTQFLSKIFPYIHIKPSASLADDKKAYRFAKVNNQHHWQEALSERVCSPPPLTVETAFSVLEKKLLFEGFEPSQLKLHALNYLLKHLPAWLNSSKRSFAGTQLVRLAPLLSEVKILKNKSLAELNPSQRRYARVQLARLEPLLGEVKVIKNKDLAELNPKGVEWLLSRISADAEIIDISGSQISDLEIFTRFSGLRELYLNDCVNLVSILGLAEGCINLRVLSFARCYRLNWNCTHLGRKPHLAVLDLQGIPIYCFGDLRFFPSLKQLNIKGCPELNSYLSPEIKVYT